MELALQVDKSTCIRCGKCVRVCPAAIFSQSAPGSDVELQHIQSCIRCGHCVAVCPTSSVIHREFPREKVHPVDKKQLPAPGQVMLLCKARRSNRAFSTVPVPEEMLEQVLEAAHRAPTASNLQQVEFTLITDPKVLQQVIDLTIEVFASLAKRMSNPVVKPLLKVFAPDAYRALPLFRRLQQEHVKGNDPILRKATALVLIHAPEKNRFGCEDSNLAYQNGSLMAESLGVSQVYTGFLMVALKQDKQKRIEKLLGIEGKVHAGMALGMPSFTYPNYIDKTDIQVKRI